MTSERRYDLCVIGAGTAGFAAAQTATADGRAILVVAGPEALGGTCIRRGCMPAKTLLRTSEIEGVVERARRVGVEAHVDGVDVAQAVARERALVEEFARDRVAELERLPLLRGAAHFVAPDAIVVDGRRVVADRFVIATGSRVDAPSIPGLDAAGYLTSDDVLTTTVVPRSLAVLGAGPVGCEFAQYFARLGAAVTIVDDGPQILRAEDDDVAAVLDAALRADGVAVIARAQVERCARDGAQIRLDVRLGDRLEALRVDAIFLATGRHPASGDLALDAGGIAAGPDGAVRVDAALRTTNPRVFAAGDVLGWRCLVSAAAAQGAHAARAAFSATPEPFARTRWDHHAVATQPQICVAGLTERAARAAGFDVRVARLGFEDVGKALVADEAEGFVKIVADRSGRLLGIAIVSEVATDLGAMAIALVDRGATVAEVAAMPYLHPTMSEGFQRAAERWLAAA